MAYFLTYAAVAVLARERLAEIRDLLEARRARAVELSDLELRLHYLASTAHDLMGGQPAAVTHLIPGAHSNVDEIGKFAILGSVGPAIPRFSAVLAPGQRWLFETMNHGSPDPSQQHVNAKSFDFLLRLHTGASLKITQARDLTDKAKADRQRELQAYVLGHLCHIATDVISQPYLQEIEWVLAEPDKPKRTQEDVRAQIDALLARRVFQRRTTREYDWADWLPTTREVPDSFYEAFAEALEDTYHSKSAPSADASPEFRASFAKLAPPSLDAALIADGYCFFRNGVVRSAYDRERFGWYLIWALGLLPAALSLPLAVAFPHAGLLFKPEGAERDGIDPTDSAALEEARKRRERAWPELLGLPLMLSAPVVFGFGLWFFRVSSGGGKRVFFGILHVTLLLLFFILYVLDVLVDIFPNWLRVVLFFVAPLVVSLAFLLLSVIDFAGGKDHRARAWIQFFFGAPALFAGYFLLFYLLLFHTVRGADFFADATKRNVWTWLWLVVLALVFLLAIAIPASRKQRDRWVPEDASAPDAEQRYARVYPDAVVRTDALGQRLLPENLRPLLKLWRTGSAALNVRPLRSRLEFSSDGERVNARFPAPLAPTRLGALVTELAAAVPGLGVALVHPEDKDLILPPGEIFADLADGEDIDSDEEHLRRARAWQALPDSEAKAFTLKQAPALSLALRFGLRGLRLASSERRVAFGPGTVTVAAAAVTGVGTDFSNSFQVGDTIEIDRGGDVKIHATIKTVTSATELVLEQPLGEPVSVASSYGRWEDWSRDLTRLSAPGSGKVTVDKAKPRTVVGSKTRFLSLFERGDQIAISSERIDKGDHGQAPAKFDWQTVEEVLSDEELTVMSDFAPVSGRPYFRRGSLPQEDNLDSDIAGEGYAFLPGPAEGARGDALLEYAADYAAMMCMGMVPEVTLSPSVPNLSSRKAADGSALDASLSSVTQVFRNWNLDSRRQNEWRMLVAGGASSERRPAQTVLDGFFTQLISAKPDAKVADAERVANLVGWVPLLRNWLGALGGGASALSTDPQAPAGIPARDLTRALAFLFDMPDPVRLSPL